MDDVDNPIIRLQDLARGAAGSLDDDLAQQAALASRLVGAETCSIMLIDSADGEQLRMRVRAHHGPLAPAAWSESVGTSEGIAGAVLAGGRALLVDDILASPFAALARRAGDPRRSLMAAPVTVDGKIVGLLNACGAGADGGFGQADLHVLEVVALFVGKSVQLRQLQAVLDSRFAQMALLQELKTKVGGALGAYQNPDQMARILARSLFREMIRAGFGSGQIIRAASEIIDQLNGNLQRHGERAARGRRGPTMGRPD